MNVSFSRAELRKQRLLRELNRRIVRDEQSRRGYFDDDGVLQGGLMAFIRYFWHVLEPETELMEGWALYAIVLHLEAVTFGEIKRLLITVPPGFMKALDCDTPILTTWGWKRHGDLRTNDFVFGPDGFPRRVEAVTEHKIETAYEVQFDDETKIVAGAGHLWDVERDYPYGGEKHTRIRKSTVVTTPELIVSVKGRTVQRPDRISLCEPIQLPPKRLLIDPYLLGAWLGDGATASGVLYCAERDRAHFEKLGEVTSTTKGAEGRQDFHRIGIEGLQTKLRVLGLLGNKHIPDDYLEASIEQRLELLRGLMDTDGHAAKGNGHCTYTTKLRHLADQIITLLCSLGMKANMKESWSTVAGERFGPYWSIAFTAPPGMKVFHLSRKANVVQPAENARSRGRYVKSVREIGERWVNCIQVEGNLYLAGKRLVTTHNSLCTDVFWPAWEWGPQQLAHLRYIAFSYSASLTERDNNRFRDLVLHPAYRDLWGEDVQIVQAGSVKISNQKKGWKLASSVGGVGTGERGNRIILDDAHNIKEAESEVVRTETVRWFRESMSDRMNDLVTDVIVAIMQRSHSEDVAGAILDLQLPYCHLMIPMEYDWDRQVDENGEPRRTDIGWFDPRYVVGDPDGCNNALAWVERFPPEVVESLRTVKGPYAYAGQYQQAPAPRGGGIFKRAWWQVWDSPDGKFPELEYIVASLDGAFTEKESNSPSALTIWGIFMHPELQRRRIILLHAWRKFLEFSGPRVEPLAATMKIEGVDWPPEIPMVGDSPKVAKWKRENYRRRTMDKWGLVEWVADTCDRFKVDKLLIEAKASGMPAAEELTHRYPDRGWAIELQPVCGDKYSRALAVQPTFSQLMVFAPIRDWSEMCIEEMEVFPKGKYLDLTDSTSQAMKYLRDMGLANTDKEAVAEEVARVTHRSKPGALYPV